MLILIEESDDNLLYEYHSCRIVVSKDKKFLHLCITAFDEDLSRSPNEEELKSIIDLFLQRDGKKLSYIKKKMFTNETIHIWEDTPFTREVVGFTHN